MKPHLAFTVENKLSEDAGRGQARRRPQLQEHGRFRAGNVARQVKPLKELLDLRTKLADLRGSLQGNDKLDEILQETLNERRQDEEAEGRVV